VAAAWLPFPVADLLSGSDGGRVVGLAVAQGRPETARLAPLLDTVVASRSAFEQFHGLVAARSVLPLLDELTEPQRELAVRLMTWSRDPRVAPQLCAWAMARLRPAWRRVSSSRSGPRRLPIRGMGVSHMRLDLSRRPIPCRGPAATSSCCSAPDRAVPPERARRHPLRPDGCCWVGLASGISGR